MRTDIPLLDLAGCRRYLEAVRERALAALEEADLSSDAPPLTRGGTASLSTSSRSTRPSTPRRSSRRSSFSWMHPTGRRRAGLAPRPAAANDEGRVEVPGGAFPMGANGRGFSDHCEGPRRHEPRRVGDFLLDRHPVTNLGRHLAFMEDGGYERPELWSAEGWAWRLGENAVEAPLYWLRHGLGGWARPGLRRGRAAVDPALPVCHVSFHEAEAHARWAGARLPTEAEWERAAAGWDPGLGACLDAVGDDPAEGPGRTSTSSRWARRRSARSRRVPRRAAPRGSLGDVWEWTSTPFDGYPGFGLPRPR